MNRHLQQASQTLRYVWTHPGNDRRRVRAVLRVLAWQIWERVARRPVKIKYRGLVLVCHPHENASAAVLYTRLPEFSEMTFMLDFLRPDDTFVDVGANVGTYTLLASSVEHTRVVAYEPTQAAFGRLLENISANQLSDRVTPRKAAAGARSGVASVSTDLGTMNRLVANGMGERVTLVALDDEAVLDRVALMKIDVEGAELAVLEGATSLIARNSPALIIESNNAEALADWLRENRYWSFTYDTRTRRLLRAGTDAVANVIAIRDIDAAEARLGRRA